MVPPEREKAQPGRLSLFHSIDPEYQVGGGWLPALLAWKLFRISWYTKVRD
jgi:hypothetical protein